MAYEISDKCIGCGVCVKFCPTEAISGNKKEKHVINPDACIECGVCGRICPQETVFDSDGQTVTRVKRTEWEQPKIDLKKCMACMSCVESCPAGCLQLHQEPASKRDRNCYPYLKNGKACIGCGFCADDCPVDAIVMVVPSQAAK